MEGTAMSDLDTEQAKKNGEAKLVSYDTNLRPKAKHGSGLSVVNESCGAAISRQKIKSLLAR
jgi:hypothetical protein